MSKKASRIDITDLISININNYKGATWLHIRRKEKSVSLTSKDFNKLIKKSGEIKRLIQKHENRKKSDRKMEPESGSSDNSDSE